MKVKDIICKSALIIVMLCLQLRGYTQSPQCFSYQAVVRDGTGKPIANQNIGLRITLQNTAQVSYYTETHTTKSNELGVICVHIGAGTKVGSNTFSSVPWSSGDVLIKIEIDPTGGTAYNPMGDPAKFQSVPYALFAENTKEVISQSTSTDDEPIFVVRNKAGQIVFAVYQTGVRVYVEDTGTKGAKGGFAVGGLSNQTKEGSAEFLRITSDSARININETATKGAKGGFAVGGLSNQSKGTSRNLMFVAPDSTRFYIDDSTTPKGAKGGFAVGGLSNQSKGGSAEYMRITSDSARININETSAKGAKGGFAVGGLSNQSKTNAARNIMFVAPDSTRVYVNENSAKGSKGGFAVGGLSNQNKGPVNNFLQLTPDNYFIGHNSGTLTTGLYNSFIGYESGSKNIIGANNVFLGYQSGYTNNASNNTFIGYQSGKSNTIGQFNSFMGYNTGYSNTEGSYNCFWGTETGYSNQTGSSNIFIGNKAGYTGIVGSNNIFLGYKTGFNNTGNYNIMLGNESGYSNSTGVYNVFMGFQSGNQNTTGSSNTFIGYQTGLNYSTGQYNTFIGYQAGIGSATLKGTGNNNVALGYKAGNSLTVGEHNVFIGTEAGGSSTGGLSTNKGENTFIGYWAGKSNTTGYQNIAIGYYAGMGLTTNDRNTIIGNNSGESLSTGKTNSFLGTYSGRLTTSGEGNTFLGYDCGYQCQTGSFNTFVGFMAGRGFGLNYMGDSSVFVGYQAGVTEYGSNKLYISNSGTSTPLIWGDFKSKYATVHGNLGINTKTPGYSVEAFGANASVIAQYSGQSRGGISALSSNRVALITTAIGDDLVFGYSSTIDQNNFSSNFVEQMRIDNSTGNVGIGTTAIPTQKLDVNGNQYISGNMIIGTSLNVAPLNVEKWTTNNTTDIIAMFNRRNLDGKIISLRKDNSEVGSISVTTSATTYSTTSDRRVKRNIVDTHLGLQNLMSVKVRDFEFINDPAKKLNTGFIAQELFEIFPDAVSKPDNEKDLWQVDYGRITPLLVKAIQDQQQQIATLKEENQLLQAKVNEIDALKAELEAIKIMMKK